MHFITKTINFIKPEGRGSSYRLAEHNGHRFLVVFDEDMDMRVMFAAKEIADLLEDDFKFIDVIGERKGSLSVVFSQRVKTAWDEHRLRVNGKIIKALSDDGRATGDNWDADCYIWDGYDKKDDFMTSMFHPLRSRPTAIAQLAAALKTARSLTHIEIPGLEVAANE